ncbi:MAG TPA: type IV secretion system DNA-binding domain-containing protein [Solirubrobacterales bacterium]
MKSPVVRSTPSSGTPVMHHLSDIADVTSLVLVSLLAGAALGVIWAVYLRKRGWAWTAGFMGVAPVVIATLATATGFSQGQEALMLIGFALGIAAGVLAWGIYMHLEDRRAGSDLAIRAIERRRLFDVLRKWWTEGGARKARALADGVPVGRTSRGELAMIGRGTSSSGQHVLIPGATGAGKTTSLAALLVDYVARSGFGAVVLEAKTDHALCKAAEMAAEKRGVPFYLFSPTGPGSYDPLAHGSVDERSERLIAVESWGSSDADFYRQAASPFLRLVLRVLDVASKPVTLANVAMYCDPDELENLALSSNNSEIVREIGAAGAGLRADQMRAIAGLRARLENLASSDFARAWLDPNREGPIRFDLRDVIEQRGVAYFRFDTDRTGNIGRAIAQMVLLDLGAAASAWMGHGAGTFVAIDEFGALEAPALDRLFARGRAAGFSVAVGTQTLADLRAAGPAVRERIGATVSGIVCHRIGEQNDAEWVAELIGAIPAWQTTIRTDWPAWPTTKGTRTRGYRFEVNPSQLQRLKPGEAYVARLDQCESRRASRVRVVPAWERLGASGRSWVSKWARKAPEREVVQ